MINGIISVLVVFVFLGIGYYFTRTKKWPESTPQVFSTTVVQIAAPAMAITSIENKFTPELLKASVLNHFCGMCNHSVFYGKADITFIEASAKEKSRFQYDFHI